MTLLLPPGIKVLNQNNRVVSEESELNQIFDKYFENIIKILGINDLTIIFLNNGIVTLRIVTQK